MVSGWAHFSLGWRMGLFVDGKRIMTSDPRFTAAVADVEQRMNALWAAVPEVLIVRWTRYTLASINVAVAPLVHDDQDYSVNQQVLTPLLALRQVLYDGGWEEQDETRAWDHSHNQFHCSQVHMMPRTVDVQENWKWKSPRDMQSS